MAEWLTAYALRQREWSKRTFGEGTRTLGIAAHIAKELDEIRTKPDDLEEWIDVMILAIDGYWRAGGDPAMLTIFLQHKQTKNFNRKWPPPQPEDMPTEHIKRCAECGSPTPAGCACG